MSGARTGCTLQGATSMARAMDYKDYYKILVVERNAGDKAIKTAHALMASGPGV